MKVRATGEYQKRNISDGVLGRIPQENEVFEVTEERFDVLNGNNAFGLVFVERLEDEKKETATPKVKKEVAKKKTTTKKAK